jgi:type II secretory pathway pseudopilin PulG
MQVNDIFYSPPRGQGRPSIQQQLARLARQKAREDFLAQQTQRQQQRQAASSTATTPESVTPPLASQPNPPSQPYSSKSTKSSRSTATSLPNLFRSIQASCSRIRAAS